MGGTFCFFYHTWWFHVLLSAEDSWEDLVSVTVNSESLVASDLGDFMELSDVDISPSQIAGEHRTMPIAAAKVQRTSLQRAASFLDRVDQRLARDRKRLRDYYKAIEREAKTPNRRTKVAPTADEIASKIQAVELEMKRKILELDERFMLDACIKPIALVHCQIPTVAIEVDIQRKSSTRMYRVYWNPLRKSVEPLACSRCGEASFNFWFTNETVDALCNTCHTATKETNVKDQQPIGQR